MRVVGSKSLRTLSTAHLQLIDVYCRYIKLNVVDSADFKRRDAEQTRGEWCE